MGLLSSLFGERPKITKTRVADLAAATLDYVVEKAGFDILVEGSLVLEKDFHPSFQSGRPKIGGDLIAVVAIADLEESKFFKAFSESEIEAKMSDSSILEPIIDQITHAAMQKFESQCPSFAELPNGKGNMFG